jgi:phage anti-repressor protein
MQNLTVIENELVPVYETDNGEKVVYGSELHEVLSVRTPYKDWSSRRLEDVDAIENEDFEAAQICAPSGQTKKDHIIKLDTAKEMAMLERSEMGKRVRRYFIQIEKKYKENSLEGLSPELKAVIIVDKRITKVEKKVEHLEYDIPLYGSEADELCNHVKRKGVDMLGGKNSNAYKDTKIRAAVYSDIYNQIKREFGLYDEKGRFRSYKALKRRYLYDAHELVDVYELPTYLAEQVSDCNAQISMEVA